MNNFLLIFFASLSFSGCGKKTATECTFPLLSFDGCCTSSGPNLCNNQGSYLFQDDYLVCKDESVETLSYCKKRSTN